MQSPQFRDDNGRPYTLHIPPAHQISEHTLPNGTTYLDEEEGGGSSVGEDQPTQEIEVHENQKYLPKHRGKYPTHIRASSEVVSNRHISFPASTSDSHLIRPSRERKERQRKSSVFSSIAALFHSKSRHVDEDETPPSGKWSTRTDKNIRKAQKEDSSDDEESGISGFSAPPPPVVTPPVSSSPVRPDVTSRPSQRLKKKTKRGSVQVHPSSSLATVDERGWASDSGNKSPSRKGKSRFQAFSDSGMPEEPTPPATPIASASTTTLKATRKPKSKPNPMLSARSPTEASLSRNSSISKHSTMSAPLPNARTTIHPASPSPSRHAGVSSSSPGRRRNASLELPSRTPIRTGSLSVTSGKVLSGAGYPTSRPKESTQALNASSSNRGAAEPEMDLMSIVEGVRRNRVTYEKQQDPNRLLVIAKAPPPVSQSLDLLDFETGLHEKDKEPAQGKEVKPTEGSISTPSLPVVPNSSATETPPRQPNGHWDKKTVPLRSALRNPSRSPSPSVSPHSSPPHSVAGPSKLRPALVDGQPAVPRREEPHEMPKATQSDADRDDVSSISSYETTHEVFDERGSRTTSPAPKSPESQFPSYPPPPPPPHDEPETKHIPSITKETPIHPQSIHDTQPPPAPRKSVRMSLPPTFSTTPPAIEDDDDPSEASRGRRPPRSQPPPQSVAKNIAWSSRVHDTQPIKDVWDDSSDEDEEYGHAKRLLSKITRKS